MMKNISDLTVVIVTYFTSKEIVIDCLNSINKNVQIKLIENSNKLEYENEIIKNYSNVKIFYTGKNLGYGQGNNFGLNLVETDYALILSPDLVCEKNFFKNIIKIINSNTNFSIIGCQSIDYEFSIPAGFFDVKKNKDFIKNFKSKKISTLEKVDWVTGCSLLINLKKFNDKNIFDPNFFLYFEEFDLCKSVIDRNENIFTSSVLKINHLGFKSSFGKNLENKRKAIRIREWHWMWSCFYFHKKNYGYHYALSRMYGKLIISFLKMIFFLLVLNIEKKDKYFYRFFGLLSAIIGKSSSYRG